MSVSKTRVEFFMRKLKWLDAVGLAVGKDHFTAHVAMVIGQHMNSDTGDTFVGRETIADLIGGHVRTVELSIQKLEALGFLRVQRCRGRGHVNTYTMKFPKKAVSTPPLVEEKAVSRPPIAADCSASPSGANRNETSQSDASEKAVSEELKGGENVPKRRSPDRPNLIDSNLIDLTLGNLEVEGGVVAALPEQPRPAQTAPAPVPKRMHSQERPRSFRNRGEFEQRIAELINEAGGDGWDVLMGLDEVRVAALCRRLKNGVLTQVEIHELCAPRRGVAHG
jgi:hypothetical protein